MDSKPRVCAKFPCRQPAEKGCNGRCENHAVKTDRGEKKLYGAEHRTLRIECFERDQWTCKGCGWCPAFIEENRAMVERHGIEPLPLELIRRDLAAMYQIKGGQWLECDHIFSAIDRPDLAGSLSNRQTLCNRCHYKKTAEYCDRRSN